MNNLPMEILKIIYSYSGNHFLITNEFYKYVMECRRHFYTNPIQINYRLAEWRYKGQPNRMIINKLSTCARPSIKVRKIKTIDISNIPIGYLKSDGNIIPSVELERKILPHMEIIERRERIYVYSRVITYNIYQCWCYDKEKVKKYVNVWPSRKNIDPLIIPYNIDGKITE